MPQGRRRSNSKTAVKKTAGKKSARKLSYKQAALQRASTPVDRIVGTCVRERRIVLGWSQEEFAEKLKISFQQVQKYEAGTNRIGASRLYQIARTLNTDVNHFYGTLPMPGKAAASGQRVAPELREGRQADCAHAQGQGARKQRATTRGFGFGASLLSDSKPQYAARGWWRQCMPSLTRMLPKRVKGRKKPQAKRARRKTQRRVRRKAPRRAQRKRPPAKSDKRAGGLVQVSVRGLGRWLVGWLARWLESCFGRIKRLFPNPLAGGADFPTEA